VHVGEDGQAGLAAHLVEDLQARASMPTPRWLLPDERLALSKEPL
jgi:hypothetical protein